MRRSACVATLFCALLCGPARAETPTHQALLLNLGLGSPLGYLGVSYVDQANAHLQLEAGVGVGWSGVQLELMPRLTFGTRHLFTSAAGLSFGVPGRPTAGNTTVIPWLDVEPVGYQYHSGTSVFSVAVGFAISFARGNTNAPICIDDCSMNLYGLVSPSLRFAWGFPF